ncbi:MAG: sodium:solute symporter family protein [Ignavibacteriaceae bacterium]|nr:sodium:solute symporter family protein [Ignavibacteriaceae bacterium]
MVNLAVIDYIIIVIFFLIVAFIGFYFGRKAESENEFQLGGKNVGLLLFIVTNVSTWYGGILGVGEFSYRYGLTSWFTQGLPYYVFAFLFAILLSGKINVGGLYSIPQKFRVEYGDLVGKIAAIFIFFLVSPAPYFLMLSVIFQALFGVSNIIGLLLAVIVSVPYIIIGGYKSDIFTDIFDFIVMFVGFIIILIFTVSIYGDYSFLLKKLPETHLSLTGGVSPFFISVWFLIALWTFADPGFHQRTTSAKSGKIAKWGIILSIPLWALFDFLTTSTGLYARAVFPNLDIPAFSYLLLAETVLSPGFKGIFYSALFATILSTANSFVFLSGTTIGNDLFSSSKKLGIKKNSQIGIIISTVVSFIIAFSIPSVIEIWYTIGSIFIPGMIILVFGAYYSKLKVSINIAGAELLMGSFASLFWFSLQKLFPFSEVITTIEPMLIGLAVALIVHIYGLFLNRLKMKNSL